MPPCSRYASVDLAAITDTSAAAEITASARMKSRLLITGVSWGKAPGRRWVESRPGASWR